MNDLADLKTALVGLDWFRNVGCFVEREGFSSVPSLRLIVGSGQQAAAQELPFSLGEFEWLPTSNSEDDPFYGDQLKLGMKNADLPEALRKAPMEVYKLTLQSQRRWTNRSSFKVGPSDLAPAALGGALFTFHKAAAELILDRRGTWCALVDIYRGGNWPCGILSSGIIVVF